MEEEKLILEEHGYHIIKEIGKGGHGTCYLVQSDKYKEDYFVCKSLSIEKEKDKFTYMNEIETLVKVSHPNIVKLYDFFSYRSRYFLILEYCECGTIEDIIKTYGSVPKSELYNFTKQLISAMVYLHQHKIAHHDIKPANILIDKYGRIKLADFGLADFFKSNEKCVQFKCTVSYAAPEILLLEPYDPFKVDVWSFGVTLFRMCTGEFPFNVQSKAELIKAHGSGIYNIGLIKSKGLYKIIQKSLTFDARDRATFETLQLISNNLEKPKISCAVSLPSIRPKPKSYLTIENVDINENQQITNSSFEVIKNGENFENFAKPIIDIGQRRSTTTKIDKICIPKTMKNKKVNLFGTQTNRIEAGIYVSSCLGISANQNKPKINKEVTKFNESIEDKHSFDLLQSKESNELTSDSQEDKEDKEDKDETEKISKALVYKTNRIAYEPAVIQLGIIGVHRRSLKNFSNKQTRHQSKSSIY